MNLLLAAVFLTWKKASPLIHTSRSQQQLADEATACMQAIIIREHEVPATQVEASGQRLMNSLSNASTPTTEAPVVEMNPTRRRSWWWSAAAAVLLVIAGTYFWTSLSGHIF